MRHKLKVAVVSAVMLLTYTTSVSTFNRKQFGLDRNIDREKLIKYLSKVLCSIDIKIVNIYSESEFKDSFLDDILAKTSSCVSPSIKMIAYVKEAANISVSMSSGAHLMILLAKEFKLENPMFPMLFRIRQSQSFDLFYIIVSEMKTSADHEKLLKVMYWNYSLLNAVVVAMDNVNPDPSVITYNPFKNETIRIPNNAYNREELFVKKNSNIFGSPLNVVMYKDSVTTLTRRKGPKVINFNYDVFLPHLISSAMNATLYLKNPFTKDLKIEDMFAADLTINGRNYAAVDSIIETGIEETIMFRRHDICILLPHNRIRNTFNVISRTVDPFVWMSMIFVTFLVWISLVLYRWAQRRDAWKRFTLFDLFGLHMNQALVRMPKKAGPRLITASCLMYCLVIKSVFEGLLYVSIARTEDTRVSTVDQLLTSNQHEILVNNLVYNYSEYFLSISPIKNRFKVIDFLDFAKRLDSHDIHYAFVGGKRGAKFFENTHIVDGLPVFYVMDECIVPFMTRYFVRLGSPFLNRINQLLRLAEESGLFDYWEEQLGNAYNKLKQRQQLFVQHSAMDLEMLDFIFHMWGVGLAIATVIFVIERLALRLKD